MWKIEVLGHFIWKGKVFIVQEIDVKAQSYTASFLVLR